jgi:hypothetical protein
MSILAKSEEANIRHNVYQAQKPDPAKKKFKKKKVKTM